MRGRGRGDGGGSEQDREAEQRRDGSRRRRTLSTLRRHAVTIVVAASLVAVALHGGGFSIGARAALHAVVAAAILAALASGRYALSRTAAAASLAICALALVAVLSATWADDPETAFAEGARWALYAGLVLLAAGTLRRADGRAVADGLAIGIVGVALVALASRAFPDVVSAGALAQVVPAVKARLSYPLQYWNGLGLLLAAGVPLLAAAIAERRLVVRLAAIAGLGAVATAIFLTSSRGAVATALLGLVALALLDGRPLAALRARASRRALAAGASATVGLAVAGLVALDPAARWARFTAPPDAGAAAADAPGFVAAHLASGGGSGRWQFWSAAVEQFEAEPITGGAAGSYEAWWAQHGTLPDSIRDAHSLGLQTLSELGLLGAAALAAFLVAALVAIAGATRAERRAPAAALAAAAVTVLAGAQIDWSWNLPAVAAVALVALAALMTRGPAVKPGALGAIAIGLVAVAGLGASLLPWTTASAIGASRGAVSAADLQGALDHALAARALQPWASSPRLQEALVRERAGDAPGAVAAIAAAVRRDPRDWRIRLVAARLQLASGDARAADASLRRVQRLAPRLSVTASILQP